MLLLKENEPISCLRSKLGAHTYGTCACKHTHAHSLMCIHTYLYTYMYIFRQMLLQTEQKNHWIYGPYLPPTMNGLFVSPLNNHLSWALLYHEVMINIMVHVQRVERPHSFSKSRCID